MWEGTEKLGHLPMVQAPQQALQPLFSAAVPPLDKSLDPRDLWDSFFCQPGKTHATPVLSMCGSTFLIRDVREDKDLHKVMWMPIFSILPKMVHRTILDAQKKVNHYIQWMPQALGFNSFSEPQLRRAADGTKFTLFQRLVRGQEHPALENLPPGTGPCLPLLHQRGEHYFTTCKLRLCG